MDTATKTVNKQESRKMECDHPKKIKDYSRGEVYCAKCGLILENTVFDFGPEWRAFDTEDSNKRSRTGSLLRDWKLSKGLTTEIDRYDRDIKGRVVPVERKAGLYRMRKWQKRSRMATSLQRNLSVALPEIDRMCSYLNLPKNLKEEIARLYRKCAKKGVVKGRSIEGMVAAVIYIISRQHHSPIILEELEEVSGVSKKKIGKCYKKIRQNIDIEVPINKPADYVSRLASKLDVSGKTIAKSHEIIKKVEDKGLATGRVPISVAAASLYIAGEETKDPNLPKKIKSIPGASKNIIRKRKEEIEETIQ
ncbi:MAG: transcription initiation factor IIB [Candidatus Altiarchaeales archaeon ex4484_2]|nr:MAG: transcription initiation factor IIB [Candidatus Altiarchaeales archaeon ex4484_2]